MKKVALCGGEPSVTGGFQTSVREPVEGIPYVGWQVGQEVSELLSQPHIICESVSP